MEAQLGVFVAIGIPSHCTRSSTIPFAKGLREMLGMWSIPEIFYSESNLSLKTSSTKIPPVLEI